AQAAPPSVEPVTNQLPPPEGSNGPVTLQSPQGPAPTPEPTPNVTGTDPPPPEAGQTTRLPGAPQPVPGGRKEPPPCPFPPGPPHPHVRPTGGAAGPPHCGGGVADDVLRSRGGTPYPERPRPSPEGDLPGYRPESQLNPGSMQMPPTEMPPTEPPLPPEAPPA